MIVDHSSPSVRDLYLEMWVVGGRHHGRVRCGSLTISLLRFFRPVPCIACPSQIFLLSPSPGTKSDSTVCVSQCDWYDYEYLKTFQAR
jgi:hypothetical protein